MIVLSLLLAATAPAPACRHLPLTVAERRADVAAINRAPGQNLKPAEIADVMAGGRWKLVWATPAEAERGVYFLRRDAKGAWRFVEVWGGVIAPEERAEMVAWAKQRGADLPAPLADCFVDALLAGK